MIKLYSIAGISLLFVMGVFLSTANNTDETKSVVELLESKGLDYSSKKPNFDIAGVSAEAGEQLFHEGFSQKPNGGKSKKQSKHFVCTSCHNVEKEFDDLRDTDPQKRLQYAVENDLPFLPASPLYGVVNRTSWYNGDYEKKYGDLVIPARKDLRAAIQLCAVECSQGRLLKNWELESVLGYLWTLELKMEDLAIPENEYPKFENGNSENTASLITDLKSYYPQSSPAHFVKPPEDRRSGYDVVGNAENGEKLFNHSCLHCHQDQRYSFFELNDSKITKKFLGKHFPKYSRYSISDWRNKYRCLRNFQSYVKSDRI